MPRARFPHARFAASADSGFLPLAFLTPRLLPASSFPQISPASSVRTYTNVHKDGGEGLGLRRLNRGTTSSDVNCLRYADISTFARQQSRSYATDTPIAEPSQELPGRKTSRRTKIREFRNIRKVEVKGGPATQATRWSTRNIITELEMRKMRPRQARRVHHPAKHMRLIDLRRRRALAITQRRLQIMLAYENASSDNAVLMHNGRYRTLQHRLYNFSRTGSSVVDLRTEGAHLQNSELLFQATAAVARRLYPGARRSSHSLNVKHDSRCSEWSRHIFRGADTHDEESVWNNWMKFDLEKRNAFWHPMLLYLLDRKPDRALQFLRVSARDNFLAPSPVILADALGILARRYIKGEMQGMRNKASFVPTFCHIFRQHLSEVKPVCTQDLLLNIARLAHAEDLQLVWHLIQDNVVWGYDTLLHWASTFGKLGQHNNALLCLKKVVRIVTTATGRKDVVARLRFRWSCALILRKSMANGENYHQTIDIVAQFLELGVKLDILLYNVIMSNAMEAGDYNVAFRVFNLLEENGVKPDKKTYSILLHGCALAENPPMFRDFATHCEAMALELQDPWLASDCLYYTYICHRIFNEEDIKRIYPLVWSIYSKFFITEPLAWLTTEYSTDLSGLHSSHPSFRRITPPSSVSALSNNADAEDLKEPIQLLPPTTLAIYLMLQLEIRRAMAVSTKTVWDLYLHFRFQVRSGKNPVILEMARRPVTWNAFLYAFCQMEQFANASHLIKSMPAPNVFSWNIFMQAFFRSKQTEAAEKVFGIMDQRDVQPDQFTFKVLLKGYAKAQKAEMIGGVMEKMDSEKQLEPGILAVLSKMRDRESLMRELERARLAKEKNESEETVSVERSKRARWELPGFGRQLRPKKFSYDMKKLDLEKIESDGEQG